MDINKHLLITWNWSAVCYSQEKRKNNKNFWEELIAHDPEGGGVEGIVCRKVGESEKSWETWESVVGGRKSIVLLETLFW
jgi:hypothetical protein